MPTLQGQMRAGHGFAMHLPLLQIDESGQNVRSGCLRCDTSYPDVTNPSLAKMEWHPIGIGNMDLAIPYIRKQPPKLLSSHEKRERGTHCSSLHAYYWCRYGTGVEAPFYLRVYVGHEGRHRKAWGREKVIAELPKRA